MAATSSKQPPKQFFKVIDQPLDQGIMIPPLFMRRHGNSLKKDVFLKVTDGIRWKVELQVINGQTWLKKGFLGFAESYFVKTYNLLVFNYEGDSRFLVSIFDVTSAEIDYSFRFKPVKVECKEDVDSVHETSNHSRAVKREYGEQSDDLSCTIVNGRRLRKRINRGNSGDESSRKLREFERNFESKNPFFACILQRSSIFPPNEVCIPAAFYRKNFAPNYFKEGEMAVKFNLNLSGESTLWPVSVYEWNMSGRICNSGWIRFAEKNGLKVGEIWIFELIVKEKVFNLYKCS